MPLRPATTSDTEPLARLWYDAWQDGHAAVAPPDLLRLRTFENFRARVPALLPSTTVFEDNGELLGFCTVEGDELNQLFVARSARGTGIAAELLADGENRLHKSGVTTAWLACAMGNDRAARFYTKCGWVNTGPAISLIDAPGQKIEIEIWRFEKTLT
jgi:GNAT superfamily N-acetyltransferase